MNNSRYWIKKLGLRPHPEGGFFKETYRSKEKISENALPARFRGERVFSTGIYFLLEKSGFSAFHRVNQDELWHYYDGASLMLHIIDPEAGYSAVRLGINAEQGERPQTVVNAGSFFAVEVNDKESFTLAGCAVAPGFEFADFEMPSRSELARMFPQYSEIIRKFTR